VGADRGAVEREDRPEEEAATKAPADARIARIVETAPIAARADRRAADPHGRRVPRDRATTAVPPSRAATTRTGARRPCSVPRGREGSAGLRVRRVAVRIAARRSRAGTTIAGRRSSAVTTTTGAPPVHRVVTIGGPPSRAATTTVAHPFLAAMTIAAHPVHRVRKAATTAGRPSLAGTTIAAPRFPAATRTTAVRPSSGVRTGETTADLRGRHGTGRGTTAPGLPGSAGVGRRRGAAKPWRPRRRRSPREPLSPSRRCPRPRRRAPS
jgi:hypothetical protein